MVATSTVKAEAAAQYAHKGFNPVPCEGKKPIGKNWQKRIIGPEDVGRYWTNGQNVGLMTGKTSNDAADVDCDCPEAVLVAPNFLPPTLRSGRESVPYSHHWFRCAGAKTLQFNAVDGTRIVELRANGGHQTLVYPSIHPDGDMYHWHTDKGSEMVEIAREDLAFRVRCIATAALIAQHLPPVGGRHDYLRAWCGFLLRGGRLDPDVAREVLYAAWEVPGDADRSAFKDIDGTIETTAKRLSANKPVQGGGYLAVYDERIPKATADIWGWPLGGDEDTSYIWEQPQPLPTALPPVESFDYRLLPDPFQEWVRDVSERMQVPPDFVAVGLMVSFAAVVGRKVGILPKRYDDWLVICNLWGAVVGRPGLLKSPALKEAMRPLDRLIAEAAEAYREEVADYEAEKEAADAEAEWFRSQKKTQAKKLDRAGLMEWIEQNRPQDPPEPPKAKRYVANDTTVEKLTELHIDNPNGLLVFRDELTGFLRNLDRYGREGDRSFYLESWNGDSPYSTDRIGRGSLYVPALCLSILGGIQPGPLTHYVLDASMEDGRDDGLLQRVQLLAWPDSPQTWTNVDRYPNHEAKNRVFDVFEFVATTADYGEPDEDQDIPALRFGPEAQDLFDTWREDLEAKIRTADLSPPLEAHISKYRSLMPALALLIEIADRAVDKEIPEAVSELSAARAMCWVEYLESHARRLYHSAERPELEGARALLKLIKEGTVKHGDTIRSIYRLQRSRLTKRKQVEEACESLADYGWLRAISVGVGGQASEVVLLNPAVRSRT